MGAKIGGVCLLRNEADLPGPMTGIVLAISRIITIILNPITTTSNMLFVSFNLSLGDSNLLGWVSIISAVCEIVCNTLSLYQTTYIIDGC